MPHAIVENSDVLLCLFQFAVDNGIDYLSWRLWIGVWIFIISVIHVATEASFLVRFVSRFTQEIFAFLISLIFIYETFYKLVLVSGDLTDL